MDEDEGREAPRPEPDFRIWVERYGDDNFYAPPMGSWRPNFVIFGTQHDGKTYLFASANVTSLEYHTDYTYSRWYDIADHAAQGQRVRHTVHAEMSDYTQIMAADYAEAAHTLFSRWNPPDEIMSAAFSAWTFGRGNS